MIIDLKFKNGSVSLTCDKSYLGLDLNDNDIEPDSASLPMSVEELEILAEAIKSTIMYARYTENE